MIRLKNKLSVAASRLLQAEEDGRGAFTSELRTDPETGKKMRTEFPNLHFNVLFQAGAGFAPIVAEIQVHHEAVLRVAKQDHKLYEVIRADSIAALAGAGGATVVVNQVDEEALKAQAEENAELRGRVGP